MCKLCGGPYSLNDCPGFLGKTLAERRNFIKAKALCYSCLRPSHVSKFCKSRLTCNKRNKKHPTNLHDYSWKADLKKIKDNLESLKLKDSDTKLILTTLHGNQEVHTKAVEGLVVTHFKKNMSQTLPRAYTQHIQADRNEISDQSY